MDRRAIEGLIELVRELRALSPARLWCGGFSAPRKSWTGVKGFRKSISVFPAQDGDHQDLPQGIDCWPPGDLKPDERVYT